MTHTETAGSDPAAVPLVSKPALWAGVVTGAGLGFLMVGNGAWLPFPVPGFLAAAITFLLVVVLAVAGAEALGRHHRAIGRAAARHGKRGASAACKGARKHGGRGAAYVAARWQAWRAVPDDDPDPLPLSVERGVAPAPAATPSLARQSPTPTGGITMTGTRPAAGRRRTAANGMVPGAWGAVVAHTADFEAESDGDLLNWMRGEAIGAAAYAEAMVEQYETCLNTIGLDPVALQTLHDVADAATMTAATMAAAVKRFAEHYELPTQFVSDGGLLAHDGRWHKGDDS